MSKFKAVSSQVDFPALEEEILKYWEDDSTFKKSIENRKGKRRFVWYEGPPTANGLPHMGHVLQRSLKDLILRYRTMKGYLVERRAGWDTHGLPVEIEVEKSLGFKGKQDIIGLKDTEFESINFFNEKCKESVFKYTDEWINLTKRIGFWIDFDNAYVTFDNDYIESIWWFISEVNKKGFLYKDYKVVPYCPRCGTSLSSHELALGYEDDIEDPSIYPLFKVTEGSKKEIRAKIELVGGHRLPEFSSLDFYLVSWTTTPWTLPGNVALAVKADEIYGLFLNKREGRVFIGLIGMQENWVVPEVEKVAHIKGEDLAGIHYEPLYSYLKNSLREEILKNKRSYKMHYVVAAEFVSTEEGTGIVHTAVMYGVEDFELGKKLDLPRKHTVNNKGEFNDFVEKFAGRFVKDADSEIIEDLKKNNKLYKAEKIKHTYPFCWRCSAPILYYALEAWFIKTSAVKDKLLEDNQKINWVPKTIKTGRMRNWLETLIDWNISRNRFWGTPLPIWECPRRHFEVIGSREEIRKLGGVVPDDLHKPYIDKVQITCPQCSEKMLRVPYVADVWMDSGAMPFAQWHYPFENEEIYKEWYPADYIVEGIDQTRGWFFTLMAEAMLLGSEAPAPFKNVISTGLILDEKGQKMSKSKGNVIDPMDMIPATGADTMRWYMYTGAPAGGNYLFSKELVLEKYRKFTLILWNCYKYFIDYANLGWKPEKTKLNTLDQWILERFNVLIYVVDKRLDKFDATVSSRYIEEFVINDLSKWYIRRSRDRVNLDVGNKDRNTCLTILYEILVCLSKLIAPFMPFLAEEMFRNLTDDKSVHLENYPMCDEDLINQKLRSDMVMVRKIVEKVHAERKDSGIKLRQPLSKLSYQLNVQLSDDLEQILAKEINVKSIEYKKSTDKEPKVKLDTKITPKLAEEGLARDLIREIQQLRKEQNLTLADKTKIEAQDWPKAFEKDIIKATSSVSISKGSKLKVVKIKK